MCNVGSVLWDLLDVTAYVELIATVIFDFLLLNLLDYGHLPGFLSFIGVIPNEDLVV